MKSARTKSSKNKMSLEKVTGGYNPGTPTPTDLYIQEPFSLVPSACLANKAT